MGQTLALQDCQKSAHQLEIHQQSFKRDIWYGDFSLGTGSASPGWGQVCSAVLREPQPQEAGLLSAQQAGVQHSVAPCRAASTAQSPPEGAEHSPGAHKGLQLSSQRFSPTHRPQRSPAAPQMGGSSSQVQPTTTFASTHFCIWLSSTLTISSVLAGMFLNTSALSRRSMWGPSRSWSFLIWSSLEMSANSSRKPSRLL